MKCSSMHISAESTLYIDFEDSRMARNVYKPPERHAGAFIPMRDGRAACHCQFRISTTLVPRGRSTKRYARCSGAWNRFPPWRPLRLDWEAEDHPCSDGPHYMVGGQTAAPSPAKGPRQEGPRGVVVQRGHGGRPKSARDIWWADSGFSESNHVPISYGTIVSC